MTKQLFFPLLMSVTAVSFTSLTQGTLLEALLSELTHLWLGRLQVRLGSAGVSLALQQSCAVHDQRLSAPELWMLTHE